MKGGEENEENDTELRRKEMNRKEEEEDEEKECHKKGINGQRRRRKSNWIKNVSEICVRISSKLTPNVGLNERTFILINLLLSFILIQSIFLFSGISSSSQAKNLSFPVHRTGHDYNNPETDTTFFNQEQVASFDSDSEEGISTDEINYGSDKGKQDLIDAKVINSRSKINEDYVTKCHISDYILHFLHLSSSFWLLSLSIHLYQIVVKCSNVSNVSRCKYQATFSGNRLLRNFVNYLKCRIHQMMSHLFGWKRKSRGKRSDAKNNQSILFDTKV